MYWDQDVNYKRSQIPQVTGKGITVAILDTGIFLHEDFLNKQNRILGFSDFVKGKKQIYDDCGHGTHIAGLVGSSGYYKNHPVGVAPECNFVIVKVLDANGDGRLTHMLRGISWVLNNKEKYKIRIVNISVGTLTKTVDCENTILVEAVNRLWDAGIVVVVAAGNNGPQKTTITTPGVSRKVITVGACDDSVEVKSSNLKNYSGRGPTSECICKPEIVAPGSDLVSCLNRTKGYVSKTGTSMATPIVSGAIALLLQKYPHLTPQQVKMKLYYTSDNIGLNKTQQGWGRINVGSLLK